MERYGNNDDALWEKLHAAKADSLKRFAERRYGMFIHWGVYSKLGGIWQGKRIEEGRTPHVAEWIMHAHTIPRREYHALARTFDPSSFDAEEIASLARDAGMKYIVITAKHHEGFALWDSDVSAYSSARTAAVGRDFISELYRACMRANIGFGVYYSHSIDWYHGGDGGFADHRNDHNARTWHAYNDWDPSPVGFDEYLRTISLPQVEELLTRFPGLSNLWLDVPYFIPAKASRRFYHRISELAPELPVCERIGNGYGDYLIPGDNAIPRTALDEGVVWETVGTINNSWGYKSYDEDWKSPREVLFWIIDVASKGGNYMLNVGPDGNGAVPAQSAAILRETGKWLSMNGDAIYGTQRWKVSHEGPSQISFSSTEERLAKGFKNSVTPDDFWFTSKNDDIFVIALTAAKNGRAVIRSLSQERIGKISLLATGEGLRFVRKSDAIEVEIPGTIELGYALRVELNE